MLFGLMNTPSTFQALINEVLKSYIRKFVLVFFDASSSASSWVDHLQHVKQAFQLLWTHKCSKCLFGTHMVAYLGHVFSSNGVAMDPAKIEAVEAWPSPKSLRALRGFLGLIGYYRKFIAGYGMVAVPLTALLKQV
ncbi:Cysteine-rich receptor-like protein kinase 37 [Zea mays]|jgi:hypothetical protein|uniref:Cysteine-rich receptor-like protein kinase 37 n=1 Tax=Zea mays TaxID=4577 RepID=A0A1D6FD75_MAIZE|nr:Cysteine-rich receptor-like protein kinase 37 [Zea mays]